MKKLASKLKTIRRQGIIVLIVLVGLAVYFLTRVREQQEFMVERGFRVLGEMSRQISDAVANQASAVANAARTSTPIEVPPAHGSPLLLAIAHHRAIGAADLRDWSNHLHATLRLVPNLELVRFVEGGPATNASAGPEVRVQVTGQGRAARLEVHYVDASQGREVVARTDLSRLLEPIVTRADFDEVLLVEAKETDGVVLLQLEGSTARVARLTVPTDRASRTNLANLGGADYLMFSQPFRMAEDARVLEPPTNWVLVGLIRSDRFALQTRSVNYTVLVMFTFVALLLILGWPLMNVWSFGLKGGLRVGEVFLLLLSTIAVVALLTLIVLDLGLLKQMRRHTDRQLEMFAGEIQQRLAVELRQIGAQMLWLNGRFLNQARSETKVLTNQALLGVRELSELPYPYFGMATWIASANGQQMAKWTVKEQTTPLINVAHREYFRTIAESRPWFLDLGGTNTLQWCLEPIFSANTGENLATFSLRPPVGGTNDWRVVLAMDCRPLSLMNVVAPHGYGFCVVNREGRVLFHSDERRNLRENLFEECVHQPHLRAAVLGRQQDHFSLKYGGMKHRFWVQPLRDTPWSLVTFADELPWGTVQVETVSLAVLWFLLYLGVVAMVVGSAYVLGGRRYLGWLWPTPSRAGSYAFVAVANALLALAVALLIALPAPDGARLGAAFLLPFLAVALGLRTLSRGTMGSARLRWLSLRVFRRLPHQTGYVLAIGTLLLLGAMLPMIACFKTALGLETRLLVKHTQLELAQDLETRLHRLWEEISGVAGPQRNRGRPLDVPARLGFYESRRTNELDVYGGFFFETGFSLMTNASAATEGKARTNSIAPPAALEWLLTRFRPLYNEAGLRLSSVTGSGAHDRRWFWLATDVSGKAGMELVLEDVRVPPRGTRSELRVHSAFPVWGSVAWGWDLLFLVVLCVPFGIVFVIADKVLLLRAPPPPPVPGSLLDTEHISSQAPFGPGRYLLLGPPRSGKSLQLVAARFARLDPDHCHRLDLRNPADRDWLEEEATERLLSDTRKAIVVDSFEHRHDDPVLSRKKLQFLRRLALDEARTVVLVSNIHPLHFRLAAEEDQDGVEASAADWVEVLQVFRRLYTRRRWDPGCAAAEEGHTTQKARATYRSIWNTCSPTEQELLHQIALGRLVSAYQPELASLLERGLIRRTPQLQLPPDPAFRRFVLGNYRPSALVASNVEDAPNLWQGLRGSILVVLVVLAAFFFLTQKEMWNHTILLITSFVTGLGAFARVFELFQKSRLKPGAGE